VPYGVVIRYMHKKRLFKWSQLPLLHTAHLLGMQVHDTSLAARMQQVAPGDTAPARVVARYQVGVHRV
jgi:hypothetical protein